MRHVGQEFGFVLGCERQLLRLVLEFLPCLFHLAVLALHLVVLLREQVGFFLQFLVRLLEFLLAGLKLLSERLRLGEQVFRAHVRLDGVEDDADGFGQLVEQRKVRGVEALERRKLEHALDLAFEDERQDEHAAGRCFAEAGGNADVVGRQVVEDDLAFFKRALADDALAEADLRADLVVAVRGEAGQQGQARMVFACMSRT